MRAKSINIIILVFLIATFLISLLRFYENNVAFKEIKKEVETNQEYLKIHINNLQNRIDSLVDVQKNLIENFEKIK